tara:strand:- start:27 stop:3818 length:3792 start_codon:yes stop_codon:yes gene_type:complete
MAIIYSYPTVQPTKTDLILGTDVSVKGKPTKNFTVQSIIDLVTVATGDLQTVLDLGFVAVGKDINLTNNKFKGAGFQTQDNQTPANVLVNITGQVGTGFTDFESTRITGTLQTPAQTNITSLGTLLDLKVGNATPAITSIVTSITAPGDNIKLATTEAIVDYIALQPSPENLFKTLQAGNTAYSGTVGFDIDMGITGTSNGNILFGNNKKIRIGDFGVTYPLEMFYGGDPGPSTNVVAILQNKAGGVSGNVPLTLRSDILDLSSVGSVNPSVSPEKYLTATKDNGVLLYFNDDKKFETLTGGAKTTGTFEATGSGTFVNLLNSGTYQDSSGDVGTAGQILSSTATGTNWITDPNPTPYLWKIEADSGTGSPYTVANGDQIHFVGVGNVNTEWNNTNKELEISLAGTSVSGSGVDGRATYWTGNQTIGSSDKYLFGSTNSMLSVHDTSDVHKGIIWADNFTTDGSSYPISAAVPKWTGSIMTNMTAITSTLFTGDLVGNASTATQLASAGTITTSGDVSLTGGPYNYTQGGNMPLATTIADSVIMGKLLDSYSAGTAGEIAATDTILQAFTKLQASITATTGLSYEGAWTPGTDATAGGTPDLRLSGAKVNGAFYICDADGTGTPNGDGTTPNSWKTGDWVIYVANGSATDEWQKLDQSNEVLGSGSPNQYTMWSGTNTIGTGVISQDTAATKTVTIGNSANLTVQGSTTLGDSNTDTTTFKGPGTFEQTARLKTGLALGTATDGTEYGTTGYALTSGGAEGNANTWTALEVGTVTSVSASTTGDALDVAVTNPTTTPAIALTWAGGASGATKYVNGLGNLITFPAVDNYQYWTLSDGTNTTNITTTGIATFASGTGIINSQASGTITTAIDYVGNNNAIEAAADGTGITVAATDKLWVSDADDNTIKQINVSQVSGVLDQGLPDVLAINNASGANNIAMADSQKITFGASGDLEIFHDTSNSYINTTSGSAGDLFIDSQGTGHDLYLQATDDVFIRPQGGEDGIKVIGDGAVELYHNGSKRFETTTTGVEVINTDTSVPAALTLSQDSKTFTITNGLTGNPTLQTTGGSFNFRTDSNFIFKKQSNSQTYATIGGTQTFSVDNQAGTNVVNALQLIPSTDTTALKTKTRVYGDLQVDGNIIHGNHGNGGTYNFTDTVNASSNENIFSITGGDGACAFTVYFTCNTGSYSVAKVYTVVHSYGTTVVYNKLVDSGPYGGHDFTPTFTGATNVLTCNIANGSGSINADISTTVILGASPQNLTVAAL